MYDNNKLVYKETKSLCSHQARVNCIKLGQMVQANMATTGTSDVHKSDGIMINIPFQTYCKLNLIELKLISQQDRNLTSSTLSEPTE